MRLLRRFALAAAALAALASPASGEERITRFVSDVQIRDDASLEVTETIDVVAENVRINRGIYRDFPTRYRGARGNQVRVGFALLGVERDGMSEPVAVGPAPNGVRIRIGDPDKLLEQGEHRYVIRYRTTRQIGRFNDFDELYWNATGNGWVFPIDSAEAVIRLPSPERFIRHAAYTGPQGSQESAADVAENAAGRIHFRTTRRLSPYEGLTVAAAFPKNVVRDATEKEQARWWLEDYGPLLVGFASLAGLLAFYFVAWKRAGRNPRPGTVVPLFSPPDDLSPAAMRYVTKMGADNRAFAAALVDLGVKGHVRMVEEDGGFFGRDKYRIERLSSQAPADQAELDMLRELAASGETIVMEQENHPKFRAAKKALSDAFKSRFEGKLFHRNLGWAFAGLALYFLALWLTAAAVVAATGVVDHNRILLAIASITATAMLLIVIQGASAVGKCLMALVAFIFAGISLALGMPILFDAFATGWWAPLILPMLAFPIVGSAFLWIAAPTREGRAVLDRIAGFKQYLSITEAERLDRMHSPEDTPELFERYLPYAIALGVENRWADRFQSVLAAAAAQGSQSFGWYSGSSDPWSNPGGFVSSVGSSLSGAVSSASTAPGSSSGSGGGGSSGGGGGGGGGGGW